MNKEVLTIYHYTHVDMWQDVVSGRRFRHEEPGLVPSRRVGRDDSEAWMTTAVFGLLKPQPDEWVSNAHFRYTWNYLKADIGKMLLEITTEPTKDTVFVADRGHIEGFLYEEKTGIPDQYLHETRAAGERAFMQSRVPLMEYLHDTSIVPFSLPEVLFTQNVPLEKIAISHQQPLLEEQLITLKEGSLRRKKMLQDISSVRELDPWVRQYQNQSSAFLREGHALSPERR